MNAADGYRVDMREVKIPWWPLFALVAAAHVALLAARVSPWDSVTKCLAAPLLIGWLLQVGAPRILALAMLFCLGGDFFLERDGMFLAGMACFALAHVCFIAFFASRGALGRLRAQPELIGVLAAAAVGLVVLVWKGIDDPVVQAVLPLYAALLCGTTATALVTERLAGLGAVAFLVSDSIIALTVFERVTATRLTDVAIMALYLAAIALLALGGANTAAHRTPAATPSATD
ncbi:MAG: lysoplasmalogenase [Aeromicrobium sp.]|uniref:lysoplasmalogenase n=1 Tax=Aeromicrobium sp. TaxID=1871063 RepID=UPI0039E5C55F